MTLLSFLRTRLHPPVAANDSRSRWRQIARLNLRAVCLADEASAIRLGMGDIPQHQRAAAARRSEALRHRADAFEALAEAVFLRTEGNAYGSAVAISDMRQCRRRARDAAEMAAVLEQASVGGVAT